MEKLEPPIKRYLTGRRPSHSSTADLSKNFKNLDSNALLFIFNKAGYLTEEYKPTKKAVEDGLIDSCEKKVLWKLEQVEEKIKESGMNVERQSVNQEIRANTNGEPKFVGLGVIATYFNVSATTIGKWLDELDLRDEEKMGNQEAMDKGLATIVEMNADTAGKKTRKIAMWDLVLTQEILLEAGHELDFDYEKSLKGKGKNSDVSVSTVDERAKDFAKEFTSLFKDPSTRKQCPHMVKKQPKLILKKAEELMKKPGFLTNDVYLKYCR